MKDLLIRAEEFHGHLGPWLVVGLRAGAAALESLGARKYFGIRVTVTVPEGPPVSCLVDGLQLSTGATAGKSNLHLNRAPVPLVSVTNTDTGEMLEIHFAEDLPRRFGAWLAAEGDHGAAARVMDAPAETLYTLVPIAPSVTG